ncbi:ubiquitin carboxyl-terminal hydrolase 14 [Blastomyces parvus]|uniref:Ubiquitin carboxyl-terminal hydrolase n=1 Tax=Blastomyces parvus TaxID=2060905 RepID=A0A2B7XIQ0_9EURO|nr:ubiquitin carboxyl-terminal hydrolase 14 [Blastomyces parvus]
MATIPVIVKHQGKRHEVDLDPTATGEIFKFQLYSLTGVEPERQKVLVKGGQLKDDTELSTLNAKPGQTFMMLGTPSSGDGSVALAKPKEAIRFIEDMTEAEVAKADGATPAGLQNLGNTCYLNSTLQTLRVLPELQEELQKYRPSNGASNTTRMLGMTPSGDLTASLKDLYKRMSETQEGFPPIAFLNTLRNAFPQFAQKAKDGHGYAQQDAEEAWSQIISQLRQNLTIKGENDEETAEISFVDKYLSGRFESILECDDPAAKEAGETAIETSDSFFKLDCHIDKNINHLRDGLLASLEEKIEKHSPTLDRDTIYTKRSQISRLPKYLTVHFVRFFWKRDVQKKVKIMRKVTFPSELDVVEFCTDELKKQLIPVRDKVREIRKDEHDMERARKRQKIAHKREEEQKADAAMVEPVQKKQMAEEKDEATTDVPMEETFKTDVEYEAERAAAVLAAKRELFELIDPKLAADDGSNKSGLYELRGVITHQGASADSGHYTSYVKKQGKIVDDPLAPGGKRREDDGKWWWFNDDKVSEVEAEKIETLSGGGESHSALILLYRAIDLPTVEEVKE